MRAITDKRELMVAFADHERFCAESLKVRDKAGVVVPLLLGPAQKRLNEIVQRQQAAGKPVRIISLKARQVWVSVGTAAQFFHGTPFLSGQHTMVLANDERTALNLFSHYKRFQQTYEKFGGCIKLPALVQDNSSRLEWANGSWVQAATTGNLSIGRSFSIRRLHLSEAAFYADLRTVMAALMGAMPKDAATMAVIESTANGIGNEFHRLWMQASDPQSGSDWEAFFFGWWEHPEYVLPLTMAPDRFQHSLDAEEREIWRRYNLTFPQLNWRRWVIANEFGGDESLFRQEYPGCPEEAFLTSGRPRFSSQHVERMPVQRNAICGGLEANQFGPERRLVFMPRERGELTIYRRPEEGRAYSIGSDSAEGIDRAGGRGNADTDYGVAQVLDRDTGEQVAVLRARIEPAEFGRYLADLAQWFNWSTIVPEANGPGISTVDELQRCGYPAALIYHRRMSPDEDPATRSDLIGWKTTTITRPQLVSTLDRAIREMSVLIHDPVTLQELRTFVIKPSGKAEAQQGCHDDTVIALALAIIGIEQMRPTLRSGNRHPAFGVPKKYGTDGDVKGNGTRGYRLRL